MWDDLVSKLSEDLVEHEFVSAVFYELDGDGLAVLVLSKVDLDFLEVL